MPTPFSVPPIQQEVNRVSEVVTSLADPSANVIFGAVIDDQYEGEPRMCHPHKTRFLLFGIGGGRWHEEA